MINKIENLHDFVVYCEQVIEADSDETEDLSTDWLLHIATAKLKKEELLQEIRTTIEIYYFWQGQAVINELYLMADVIKKAIDVELIHYLKLGVHLKIKIKNDVYIINNELKTKYLDV